ncbi:endonuclease V [Ignicoccus pacificus DSM 13166]|uniref:Endonuclease V n=1 Tax=Ignicoccus pacificus DSM 13166 TaxID=940294 RepID=A0A977KBE0_9CREN|nr:endonuclease V [Ignicoccus pacificus DSM 13166]
MLFRARRARALQEELAKKVVAEDCFEEAETVGGLDVSYKKGIGCAVLSVLKDGEPVKFLYTISKVPIPYVPGFLAFREVPLYIPLLKEEKPSVVLVDGHGIAHPRGLGVASHVGVVTGVPTIGVAKKRLVGEEGSCEYGKCLFKDGKVIAAILERGKRRIYVSVGHCVSLRTAVEIVKTLWKSRLPEPIRLSDSLSRRLIRQWSP